MPNIWLQVKEFPVVVFPSVF